MLPTTHIFHLEYFRTMRDAVGVFLTKTGSIRLTAASPEEIDVENLLFHRPADIVLLGINEQYLSPGQKPPAEWCRYISVNYPTTKIIVHSIFDGPSYIASIMSAGATAFISKRWDQAELLHAIDEIKQGRRYIGSRNKEAFRNATDFNEGRCDQLVEKCPLLSKREHQLLKLLAEGLSNKEIAAELDITIKTVEAHRKNLIAKCKVKNTAQAISFCYEMGLL